MTLDEARQAAEYFHSIKPVKRLRIVETDTVPVTHPGPHAVQVVDPSGAAGRLVPALLKFPKTLNEPSYAIPVQGLSHTCRRAAFKEANRW